MSDPTAEVPSGEVQGRRFSGADWYAEELDDVVLRDCVLVDVDLTEASTRGATFER